jgi:serine protease Do
MITKIVITGVLLTFFFVLAGAPVQADVDVSSKVYPLSISELEGELCLWLEQSGFAVRQELLRMGQIKLIGSKEGENWEILLRPHSPLATDVRAKYCRGDQAEKARLQDLWDRISAYMDMSSYEIGNSNQVIPNAVLARIESVVCINAKVGEEDLQFSGFVVDREGLIICTAHSAEVFKDFTVALYDGREMKGRLVRMDRKRDLALVHIDSKLETFVSLAKGRNLAGMGERLYSVGCPINLRGSVYSGVVNGPPRRLNGLPLWQIDMQIYPGSSGSPVFDIRGTLVAVVKGRYRGTDSVGFLIPLETIMEFLKESSSQ